MKNNFKVKARVRVYNGPATWYFADVPKKLSTKLTELFRDHKRGWGSLPVIVTLGKTVWKTSIFPQNKKGMYLLPLKAEVRKKEEITDGDVINFSIKIRL